MSIVDMLGKAGIVPVIVIEDEAQAVPLAKALVKGGAFREAAEYLATLAILPSEHKDNAHAIWVDAWKGVAAEARAKGDAAAAAKAEARAAEYPENLGAGKPFPPED